MDDRDRMHRVEEAAAHIYVEWQIELVASARAALFNVSGQAGLGDVLVGITSRTAAPGGRKPASSDSRLGAITAGRQFRSDSLSDAQVVVDVERVVEQSSDVRRTGGNTLDRSMLESPADFEGVYLAVDAPDSTSLAVFSSSQRYGSGAQ